MYTNICIYICVLYIITPKVLVILKELMYVKNNFSLIANLCTFLRHN